MALNVSNILDQHSELIEEEIFKLFCLMYDASDNFTLFRDFFINSSSLKGFRFLLGFYKKMEPRVRNGVFFWLYVHFVIY